MTAFIEKLGQLFTLDALIGNLTELLPVIFVLVIFALIYRSSKKMARGASKGKVNY